MKRKLLTILLTASVLTMTIGLAAFAAPQTMPDGQVFDPEFYAQTYPDVAAAFGTDANALYQHYVTCGKAEGRIPYSENSNQAVTPTVTNDYDITTNVLRSFGSITFQSPVAWGDPTVGDNVLRWFLPGGFVKVTWIAPTNYSPASVTNDQLEEVATRAFSNDSIAITSMQYITLANDNRNALLVTGTGTEYDEYGTTNYVLFNTPSGVYLMVYFMNANDGVNRLNDFTQMLNSVKHAESTTTVTAQTSSSPTTNTGASTSSASSSSSSGYKYSYSEYQAQKERDYAQYQREKEQSYKNNRNKSYSERRSDYEKVYKRNQMRRKNTYNKYH